jgi:hypothetical protein
MTACPAIRILVFREAMMSTPDTQILSQLQLFTELTSFVFLGSTLSYSNIPLAACRPVSNVLSF